MDDDAKDKLSSPPTNSENELINEEVFRRDLNEVHLLIEFISGLPGKSLNDLTRSMHGESTIL